MMCSNIFFLAGLPRSGSTLLQNILNQNSDLYASPTSGVIHLVKPILSGWSKIPEFLANSSDRNKKECIKGLISGYYSEYIGKTIIDKSRGWPSEIESLMFILEKPPKIILSVRDCREILCSWEKMYRRDKQKGRCIQGEATSPQSFISLERRFEYWSTAESPLGAAFNIMRDAFNRGHAEHMYFFEYEKWTRNPEEEFSKLYEWLELPYFQHDFNNIKQVLFEKDEYYGYTELHSIKEGKLEPAIPQWERYMSKQLSEKYARSNIWIHP